MAYESLEKELKDLPGSNKSPAIVERKHPERKLGILQGKFVMADDFDETPDHFKEYM